jgi:zinc protease
MNPKRSIRQMAVGRTLSFILVCLTLAPAALLTSLMPDQTVAQTIELKNKAPVSNEPPLFPPIRFSEFKLENGLTVIVREDHRFPTVNVQMNCLGAGPIYDPPSKTGLAFLSAQLSLAGTTTRTASQITEEADRLGTYLTVGANFGSTVGTLTASGLSDNFEQWFSLMADVLRNPIYPPDTIARQRTTLAESLNRTSLLDVMAARQFTQAVFRDHPAAAQSVDRDFLPTMTPAMLAVWHQERYAPQNAVLGIEGDINSNDAIAVVKKILADWQKTTFVPTPPPDANPASNKRIMLVDEVNSESISTALFAGNIAIDRRSPDFFALLVMNQILGGGYTSRLQKTLQSYLSQGLFPVINVASTLNAGVYRGEWHAYAWVRNDALEKAVPAFFTELSRTNSEKVSSAELEEAKKQLIVSYSLSLEDPATILNNEMIRRFNQLPADYWGTYAGRIAAVTNDDVLAVARKFVRSDSLQIAAAGDLEQIRTIFQKLGPVEVYSTRNRLKGCIPAAQPVAGDLRSVIESFVSFTNTSTSADKKWNPGICLAGANQCAISSDAMTSCTLHRSSTREDAEKAYRDWLTQTTAALPSNWKSEEKFNPNGLLLRECRIRTADGAPIILSVSLRVRTEGVDEEKKEIFTVTIRFGNR